MFRFLAVSLAIAYLAQAARRARVIPTSDSSCAIHRGYLLPLSSNGDLLLGIR